MRIAVALVIAAGLLAGGPSASAASGDPGGAPPFGLGAFDPGEPIAISADKLEAREEDGVRTLAFQRNVEVHQGALELRAERLEARFPEGARQPVWLRARGDVRIREGERRARCDDASYDRNAQRIVCRGEPARLQDGADTLAGRVVVFDLAARRVTVQGGTEVEIHRSLAGEGEPAPAPDATPPGGGDSAAAVPAGRFDDEALERIRSGGPVAIRADELEARERDGARTIHFQGDVRVRQGALGLRADELEAVYPAEGQAQEPDRLLARGDVVVQEGEREARCDRADYRPRERRVTCEGDAHLRDGSDRLSGERIAFDFGAQRVRVEGATRLVVQGRVRP